MSLPASFDPPDCPPGSGSPLLGLWTGFLDVWLGAFPGGKPSNLHPPSLHADVLIARFAGPLPGADWSPMDDGPGMAPSA